MYRRSPKSSCPTHQARIARWQQLAVKFCYKSTRVSGCSKIEEVNRFYTRRKKEEGRRKKEEGKCSNSNIFNLP
ncbi:MAG: hypothetical protein MUE44_12565 [Oscillatoriaceae cyanobacterium Prado104]|nr:hypothetical protein [Oscillatoriaceae cyanobacterium Prado104]